MSRKQREGIQIAYPVEIDSVIYDGLMYAVSGGYLEVKAHERDVIRIKLSEAKSFIGELLEIAEVYA